MFQITYGAAITAISFLWVFIRICVAVKQKTVCWKREALLLLVYVCLIVVARFVFFPVSKVNGVVQPLVFDKTMAYPFRINLIPFAYLMDYEIRREAWLNLIGNTAMFIPIGIVWPSVFRKLDTHKKILAAGIGMSLAIEIIQLPFYDRVTDIDDLILNALGFAMGYGLFLLVRQITKSVRIRMAIKRVQRMERIFEELSEVQKWKNVQMQPVLLEKYRILIEYYDSDLWMQDYQMDERGELPQDLKRGVLSEDGIYNLLTELEQEES